MLALLVRLTVGACVARGLAAAPRPAKPLELYEYEACPFCRRVREVITILDLDVVIYPTPRETLFASGVIKESRFRPVVQQIGGKVQFPLLVDPNTNTTLYESSEIVKYLFKTYGLNTSPPLMYRLLTAIPSIDFTTLYLVSMFRPLGRHGLLRQPSKAPAKPLELWAFENSPVSRVAKETLCSLEIPYLLHPSAIGSSRRAAACGASSLQKLFGFGAFPKLFDPNTNKTVTGSCAIERYLHENYATGPAPEGSLETYLNPDKKPTVALARDAASAARNAAVDAAVATREKVGAVARDAVGKVGNLAGEARARAGSVAGSAANKGREMAGTTVERARDLAESAAEKTKEVAGQAIDAARTIPHKLHETRIGAAAEDAAHAAKNAAAGAVATVIGAATAVKDAASGAATTAKRTADDATHAPAVKSVAAHVDDAADRVADAAESAKKSVEDAAKDAKDAVTMDGKAAGEKVADKAAEAKDSVVEAARETSSSVSAAAKDAKKSIEESAKTEGSHSKKRK